MVTKGQWRQYFAAFSCHLSAVMASSALVWYNPLMVRLTSNESEIQMTYDQLSWIVSVMELAEALSPIPAALIANRVGRKKPLLTSAAVMLVSWIILATTRSVSYSIAARILQGISAGIVQTLAAAYVAEIAETDIRGELCAYYKTMANLGALYVCSTGPFISYQVYIYTTMATAVLFTTLFFWMPESPHFLFMAGRREEAIETLKWFRGRQDVEEEATAIEATVKDDMESSSGSVIDLFKTSSARKALFIVFVVSLIKYSGGSMAIITYSTKFFAESSLSLPPEYGTIVLDLLLTITTLMAATFTDRIGRKPLLLISSAGMAFFSFLIAAYFYLKEHSVPGISLGANSGAWVMYTSTVLFCIATSIGLSPTLPALQTEYFTSGSRGPAGAVTSIMGTLMVFVSVKQFQIVEEALDLYANFLIFSIICLVGLVILYLTMEESAKRPLGEAQRKGKVKS